MAHASIFVKNFKGHRQISSLPCYPLKYHKDPEKLREQLIERGKCFAALEGQQYRYQRGIAFHKVTSILPNTGSGGY